MGKYNAVQKVFKYAPGDSPYIDSVIDHYGSSRIPAAGVEKIARQHGTSLSELAGDLGKAGKAGTYSVHKLFNVLGYEMGIVGMPKSSWDKAQNAAAEVYESPAIRKARVKPIRRGGI
jgi:hypothetical protein